MPNVIKIGGGQEHFGLFLVDFIWNDPFVKPVIKSTRTTWVRGDIQVLRNAVFLEIVHPPPHRNADNVRACTFVTLICANFHVSAFQRRWVGGAPKTSAIITCESLQWFQAVDMMLYRSLLILISFSLCKKTVYMFVWFFVHLQVYCKKLLFIYLLSICIVLVQIRGHSNNI